MQLHRRRRRNGDGLTAMRKNPDFWLALLLVEWIGLVGFAVFFLR